MMRPHPYTVLQSDEERGTGKPRVIIAAFELGPANYAAEYKKILAARVRIYQQWNSNGANCRALRNRRRTRALTVERANWARLGGRASFREAHQRRGFLLRGLDRSAILIGLI